MKKSVRECVWNEGEEENTSFDIAVRDIVC